MKLMSNYLSLFSIILLGGLLLLIGSCDPNLDPDKPGNPNNPNSTPNIDPDQVSEYLVLANATKITGDLPTATDGQLKINVQDTLFLANGFPLVGLVEVKHEGTQDITGFYVQVSGAALYHDVPEYVNNKWDTPEQGKDSTTVVFVDIDIPKDTGLPITFEIIIQPHGPDGTPVDEFIKWVMVEDSENCDCDLTGYRPWEWTITFNADWNDWDNTDPGNDNFIAQIPELATRLNIHGWGCCKDGKSYTPNEFMGSTPCTQNQPDYWKEIEVYDYVLTDYDILTLYPDGTFGSNESVLGLNYDPEISDYCAGEAGYQSSEVLKGWVGIHDYTPCTNQLTLKYKDPASGNYYYYIGGEILATCHALAFVLDDGEGGKWSKYYKRTGGDLPSVRWSD